ncbi:MAG: rRNA maturation RNase YbeY [Clostridia bacterium]|nr:rRNA maturation RNase YbeY [Clostridia bacterium]
MSILIENLQNKIEFSDSMEKLIGEAVLLSFKLEGFEIPCEVSIFLVDDREIREINKDHRKIDKATDVLSFPMIDMIEGKIQSSDGDYDMDQDLLLMGDIMISMERAEAQAREYGHSFHRELAFLVTHGVYHLLGYDHVTEEQEKKMLDKQEAVLGQMRLVRNEE